MPSSAWKNKCTFSFFSFFTCLFFFFFTSFFLYFCIFCSLFFSLYIPFPCVVLSVFLFSCSNHLLPLSVSYAYEIQYKSYKWWCAKQNALIQPRVNSNVIFSLHLRIDSILCSQSALWWTIGGCVLSCRLTQWLVSLSPFLHPSLPPPLPSSMAYAYQWSKAERTCFTFPNLAVRNTHF